MTFLDKAYTLREESVQSITHYYIRFTDSAGNFQDLEVSETLYFEFRQLERKNRNLQQSDQRHKEHNTKPACDGLKAQKSDKARRACRKSTNRS